MQFLGNFMLTLDCASRYMKGYKAERNATKVSCLTHTGNIKVHGWHLHTQGTGVTQFCVCGGIYMLTTPKIQM